MCARGQERVHCPEGCYAAHLEELRQPFIERRFHNNPSVLTRLPNLVGNPLVIPLLLRADFVLYHAIIVRPEERNDPRTIAISPIGNISENALRFLFQFAAEHLHAPEEGERNDQ